MNWIMTNCPICMNYDKTTLKMSVALSKVRMLVVVLMIVVYFYGLFHVCFSYDGCSYDCCSFLWIVSCVYDGCASVMILFTTMLLSGKKIVRFVC